MSNPSPVALMVDHLNRHGYTRRSVASSLGLKIYKVDLSNLRLRLSESAPIIEFPAQLMENKTPIEIYCLVRDVLLKNSLDTQIPILCFENLTDELRGLFFDSPYQGRVGLIDGPQIQEVIASTHPSDTLLCIIRDQVSISILSPYEVTAPVTGSQFFGRAKDIRTIINHPNTNYLIIGSRRLGKTSLLKEVQRRLLKDEEQNSEPETLPTIEQKYCYFDCMSYNTVHNFLSDAMTRLNPREYNRLGRTDPVTYFPIFLRNLSKRLKGEIVFFMDEVDHLLLFDRTSGYMVTRLLMAGASSGYCRLIWAGFREANEEITRLDSPGNAKFTSIPLQPFRMQEIQELVMQPMLSLGIGLRNRDEILKRIERDSGGHPNFIQYICETLVQQADREGLHEITPASLAHLTDDQGFRDRVIGVFTANTNDFEKAVAYSVSHLNSFTIEEVDQELSLMQISAEISDIEDALKFLFYIGILQQPGAQYSFTVPVLPQLLRERYREKFIHDKAIEFLRKRIPVR